MLQAITYGKKFCATEHVSENNQEQIHGLVLSRKKKELVIDTSFDVDGIEKLKDHIPARQHLFLIINNNKILFKSLSAVLEPLPAVHKAFPNLRIEDFYYETYVSNDKTFVAICRKKDVHELLSAYKEKQYSIIGFSLGNLSISILENFIDQEEICTSNAVIQFKGQKLLNLHLKNSEKKSFSINGLELNNCSVLSLSGILIYYTKQSKTVSNFKGVIHDLKQTYKQQCVFNHGLKISLATIFVLLLFSFSLFTYYNAKIEGLSTNLTLNKTKKTTLLKLTNEVQKKEKLINDFSLTSSKSSWYFDQIAQTLPNSILLVDMEFQPLAKNLKKGEEITVQDHYITIQGHASENGAFSHWIHQLEEERWIEKVTILDYGKGKKKTTSFEILMTVK